MPRVCNTRGQQRVTCQQVQPGSGAFSPDYFSRNDRIIQQAGKENSELSASRILMRNNLERISTGSVTSEELDKQRVNLRSAERKLERMGQRAERVREKIAVLRQQLAERRSLQKERGTAQTKRALAAVMKKLDSAVQQRHGLLSEYREQKLMVRDQRALCRSLEKKEEAMQKAVARFLKQWERDYDREIRLKEKAVRKRERLVKL
jgi:hypothetical protein